MIFQPAILYVDDEPANLNAFKRAFGGDYRVQTCLSGEEALALLEKEDFPLVIADQRMPGMAGIELCERLFATRPDTVRIILTAYTGVQVLLEAIQRGHVHDYIVKPWKKSELMPVLNRVFEDLRRRKAKIQELEMRASQTELLREEMRGHYDEERIVGAAGGLLPQMEVLKKAAPSDSTILLLGETGTGKELMARAIHAMSPRRGAPFVPVHCAALAQTLLESELFGHEKGAFTGAEKTRIGRFEIAKGGTLFLDEIGEIPADIQVKLLRVLQEREIQRVGGNRSVPVDVRLVAATHRDLEREVSEGGFREDLYYRLNVIAVKIPPLRDRRDDIPALAHAIVEKLSREKGTRLALSPAALASLANYDWPGNVRELENILERAVILCPASLIEPEDLNFPMEVPTSVEKVEIPESGAPLPVRDQIRKKEAEDLTQFLIKANGNVSETARLMGIARTTLIHRLKKYRLI